MREMMFYYAVCSFWLCVLDIPCRMMSAEVPIVSGFRIAFRNDLKLRGGSSVGLHESETVDIIANSESFRKIVETSQNGRIRVEGSEQCVWDWRVMCPWAKEMSDENKQFLLESMPRSKIHISSLQMDEPARLDGQWKMGRTRSGSFRGVHLSHFTDVPDARILVHVYGGPWMFEDCEVARPNPR